jgi:Putative zinc-finger
MMCPIEELEALLAGELDAEDAARVQKHVAGCAACKDELAWLSAEAELMARRRATQPPVKAEIWQGIAERIAAADERKGVVPALPPEVVPLPARARRRWGWAAKTAYGGLLAAAAAAVVFATWPGQLHNVNPDFGHTPSVALQHKKVPADVALDKAEREYQEAAKVLEAEYAAERDKLPPSVAERYDRMLSATRTQVADARATAGNDVDGRMVVLDGYAEYLRSLQTIVTDIR